MAARAVAQGMAVHDAAKLYLGSDRTDESDAIYKVLVNHLRALARRNGVKRWRLIGIRLKVQGSEAVPSLDQWSQDEGLDDWSEEERLALYKARFPVTRKEQQLGRLRVEQLEILRELERAVAARPSPLDPLDAWFDPAVSKRLRGAGIFILEDLQRVMKPGGRWYAEARGIGAVRAKFIGNVARVLFAQFDRELNAAPPLQEAMVAVGLPRPENSPIALSEKSIGLLQTQYDGRTGINRVHDSTASLSAVTDRDAIEAWLIAKAGTKGSKSYCLATSRAYRLEAERLLLWCICERRKPLSSMTSEDCTAYLQFLANIPEAWISRRHARRGATGWAPFAGPLSISSQQRAINIVAGMFGWLVSQSYLRHNPWGFIKRRLGDDPGLPKRRSRAMSASSLEAVLSFLDAQRENLSAQRARFVLAFCGATGLRAAELLGAKLGDFAESLYGVSLHVHGKGSRNREIAVPPAAVRALEVYLQGRGVKDVWSAAPHEWLVCKVDIDGSTAAVSYRSILRSLQAWVRRASAALPDTEGRRIPQKFGLHTLRHTCFTNALMAGVPLQVVQTQAGHQDPATTMLYAQAPIEHLQAEMAKAFR